MGILYESMKKVELHQEMKRNILFERLEKLDVKEHKGTSIYDLNYEDLKVVLVLAEMKQVDIEHPDHKWFK